MSCNFAAAFLAADLPPYLDCVTGGELSGASTGAAEVWLSVIGDLVGVGTGSGVVSCVDEDDVADDKVFPLAATGDDARVFL